MKFTDAKHRNICSIHHGVVWVNILEPWLAKTNKGTVKIESVSMTATESDSDNLTSKTEDNVNAFAWSSLSNGNVLGTNDKFINTSVQLYTEPVFSTSFPDIESYANSSLSSSAMSVSNVTGQDINSTSSNWILSSSRTNISGADIEDISTELLMSSGISVSSRDTTSKNANTFLISPELSASSRDEDDIKNKFLNTKVISGGTSINNIAGQGSYNMSWNTSPASSMSDMKIDDVKNNYVNSLLTINGTSVSGAFDLSIISTDSSVSPSGRSDSGVMPGSVAVVHDVNISKNLSLALRNASTSGTTAQDANKMSADTSVTSLPGTLITTTGARDTNDRIVGSSFESSKVANENTISFISHVGVSKASFPFGGISFLDGSFSRLDSLNVLEAGIPQGDGVTGAGITSVDDVIPDTSFVYDKGMGGERSRVNGPNDTYKENGNNLSNSTFVSVN